jgi:hypothetical protein
MIIYILGVIVSLVLFIFTSYIEYIAKKFETLSFIEYMRNNIITNEKRIFIISLVIILALSWIGVLISLLGLIYVIISSYKRTR